MRIFKFINGLSSVKRWSNAYCQREENVLEHTAVVSIIALRIGQEVGADLGDLLSRAILHDMEEMITGDIPTPTKYHNEDITREIKKFEEIAAIEVAARYFGHWAFNLWSKAKDDSLEGEIIKIADSLAVVYKIKQETDLGNPTFHTFKNNIHGALIELMGYSKHKKLLPFIHEAIDILGDI